jgi:DNA-binding NarL/FixJ family response regulator
MNDLSSSISVLLVDPQAVVRAGLKLFLEQAPGIHVAGEAIDGNQALIQIETLKPDVIISDIQTPGVSGFEIARRMQAAQKTNAVLLFTANDDDIYISAFLKSGARGYLLKTASPEEIITAVQDVFQKKSVIDKAVLHKVLALATTPIPQIERLSEREIEILTLVAKGLTNKVIAHKLSISDRTVQGHIARIFEKLHANSRTDAVMRAISGGVIQSPEITPGDSDYYEI